MNITIRPAGVEDVPAFVRFVNIANHDLTKHLLGSNWQRTLTHLARQPKHPLSYDTAHFIEVEGAIAGMISGCARHNPQRTFWLTMRYGLAYLPQTLYHLIKLRDLWSAVPPATFCIQYIALAPEYEGLGLNTRLLRQIEDHATSQGFKTLALTVRMDNARDIEFYRLYGFHIESTSPQMTLDYQQIGQHRMTKPLA